ncbi:aminoglycoside phosphotransferase (APT) family kinase protein [Rhodoligotrophos appendicifer]|uniref:phosphotransferase family protein n=1 Tax=Rhodoligotrophos appendicifer TaxID=987056 RepID=UPI00117EC316|nr:phosphotransferase family protein [Rhodoligotrophos appendicifer]
MTQNSLNVSDLAAYLEPRLDGDWSALQVKPFVGGQSNPTFLLQAGSRPYVLRKRPGGTLLPSAHAIDREYRVMSALQGTAVPVPMMRLFCNDDTILGTTFFVMDYVAGRVLKEPALPGFTVDERKATYEAMNAAIAALHRIDIADAGLADYGRPQGYYARQVKRWTEQYRASETETLADMEELISWLPANLPEEGPAALVHGDFRLENLILDEASPRVLAVLDWELSTLGDPLGDLAYHCLPWHLPPHAFGGLAGCDISASGIPSEEEYLAAYCRRTGRAAIVNWHFYVAFALFRLAAILQGVLKRALDGNAASPDARERGALAGTCAACGWAAVVNAKN